MKKSLGNIYFAASKTCNLKCSYCYVPREYKVNPMNSLVALSSFKRFIDKLIEEDYTVEQITWHGAESTMLSEEFFIEAQKYYIEKIGLGKKKPFAIQSNGVNISSYLDIWDPDLIRVGFSLDGYKENNDFYRGEGVYDKVIENIKKSVALGFYTSVLCVVNRKMAKNLDKFIDFIKYLRSLGVITVFKTIHTDDPELSMYNEDGYNYGYRMEKEGLSHCLQTHRGAFCMTNGNYCMFYEFDKDGLVYTCNKNFSESKSFSNWFEESFDNIVEQRKEVYVNRYTNPECHNCKAWYFCQGWCPTDREEDGRSHECYVMRGSIDASGHAEEPYKQFEKCIENRIADNVRLKYSVFRKGFECDSTCSFS